MLYTKSGLLGVSGLSNDMRVLRAKAATERGCQDVPSICSSIASSREIGSLVAALGGIDGLVFTAGHRRERRRDPRRGDRRPRMGRAYPR